MSTDLFERMGVNGRDIIAGKASEHLLVTRPSHFKGLGWLSRLDGGTVLLAAASVLLAANAAAMGIVSWHAQYAFVLHVKHQHAASALEALGLDTAAVIFAIYGIALARLGRRALIERALVVACALGSCGMNLLGADLGSPRSVAVFVMPALLFAAGADRLIAVVRRAALGRQEDDDNQRSAWRLGGRAVLYVLRFALAPPSTAAGARRALLNATPLPPAPESPSTLAGPVPAAPGPAVAEVLPELVPLDDADDEPVPPFVAVPPRPAVAVPPLVQIAPVLPPADATPRPREGTKTAELLRLAADRSPGGLAAIDLAETARIATALAPEIDMHPGSARTALRSAVLAAQAGGAR